MAGPQAQQGSASRATQPLLSHNNQVHHTSDEVLELVTRDDIRQHHHVEIEVEEDATSDSSKRVRQKHRPLYRRFFSYIKSAWTGVNFSSGNDSELEELETPPRYRPDSLSALCRATRFSEAEIKRIYRGFKAECPTGVVREDTFKVIYSQFFPQGANSGQYAHYVFNTLDQDRTGIVSFEEFVQGLSILSRGSLEEKLRWTFSLYDINGDGFITREEMTDIATAIYDLAGNLPIDPTSEEDRIKEKVDRIFQETDICPFDHYVHGQTCSEVTVLNDKVLHALGPTVNMGTH
ncbi:Kv channel-interacting protein 4 isoform X1 [Sergentomyia squamirostris]